MRNMIKKKYACILLLLLDVAIGWTCVLGTR